MKRGFLSILLILGSFSLCDGQTISPQPNKKGLWGYVNEKGKYVVTPSFEYAEPFEGPYAKCRKDGNFGFIDLSGTVVVDFVYETISPSGSKNYQIGKRTSDDGVYIISFADNYPKTSRFDTVADENRYGYTPVKLNGKTGFIDKNGIVVVSPKYQEDLVFSAYGFAVTKSDKGWGIVNQRLEQVVPDEYAFVRIIDGGNFIYGNDSNEFGLVSKNGKIIFPETKYSQTRLLEDSKCIEAKAGNKITILDLNGKSLITECDNYSIAGCILTYSYDGNTLKINTDSGARAIVLNGKDIWTPEKSAFISFEDPFVLWKDLSGKEHRMTTEGSAVFEGYDKIKRLSKDLYSVNKNGQYALANAAGRLLSEWVDGIISIDGEYLQLIKKGNYGRTYCAIMRGSNGKMVTGWDFAWVYPPLKNGLIPVKLLKGDNLSRTEKKLKMVGDNFYIANEPFEGFYAITDFKTKKMGVMTESGKILVSPKYDEVGDFHCGMCRVWIAEKGNGFINKSGTLVVACKYPQVLDFGTIQGVTNYTQVWDNYGYTYYIDKNGKTADPDKVLREAYNSQRQNSWY